VIPGLLQHTGLHIQRMITTTTISGRKWLSRQTVNYRRLASQQSQLEFAHPDDTRGSIFQSWLVD